MKCTVAFFGPSESGKSQITNCLRNGFVHMEREYFPSAGILGFSDNVFYPKIGQVNFKATEISGEYLESDLRACKLKNSKIQTSRNNYIVLTFSRKSLQQFNRIKELMDQFTSQLLADKIVYILGTFSDCEEEELEVTNDEARYFALSHNAQYIPFSGYRPDDVKALFTSIATCQALIQEEPEGFNFIQRRINFVASLAKQKVSALYQIKAMQNTFEKYSIRKDIACGAALIICPYATASPMYFEQEKISLPFLFV